MTVAVRFYRDVLGMEIIYGGEDDCFSSLRTQDENGPILNLEQGRSVTGWGRMIFYVADVDAIWAYLREKGFHPETPQDASCPLSLLKWASTTLRSGNLCPIDHTQWESARKCDRHF